MKTQGIILAIIWGVTGLALVEEMVSGIDVSVNFWSVLLLAWQVFWIVKMLEDKK